MKIPLWDRRIVPDGSWKNIYLIPEEIYKSVKKNRTVKSLTPEQLYVLEYYEGKRFQLITNFHFISIDDGCERIDSFYFETDVHKRVGFAQYLWWNEPKMEFSIMSKPLDWGVDDYPWAIALLFSYYPENSFAPFIYGYDEIDKIFDVDIDNKLESYSERTSEQFIDKRFKITKWSLDFVMRRLKKIELYKDIDLKIIKC